MKVKQLYDYITKEMTPEQALMKLLESSVLEYEKLKFDKGKEVHPLLIISMAAMDLGWTIAVKSDEDNVSGLAVGTEEYMNSIFNSEPTK